MLRYLNLLLHKLIGGVIRIPLKNGKVVELTEGEVRRYLCRINPAWKGASREVIIAGINKALCS